MTDEIIEKINLTAEVVDHIEQLYNFKAADWLPPPHS